MGSSRRKSPKTQLRELVKRTGLKKLAKKLERPEKTITRWLAQGPPANARDELAEAYERSEKSRRAAAARAERAAAERAQEAERERAAQERRLENQQRRAELSAKRRAEQDAKDAKAQRLADRRSKSSKRSWGRRKLRRARVEVGPHETGRNAVGHHLLRGLLGDPKNGIDPDPMWLDFLERCRELGFSDGEARSEWFSPELIG